MAEETILQWAGHPPEPDPEAPIYAELARRWQSEGRSVPGLPDPVREPPAAPGASALKGATPPPGASTPPAG
ncbi:hypothetical protein ACIRVF_23925 [Kitasatospora sp. NPDC101157]|uniref:hypothetical protein n=1 Tax=Kitasatospora sp. NPDC101157 TaxID=3364098 RepID=UPI0038226BC3